MRILNVSSLYPPNVIGGAEFGIQTIAAAIADAGHDVHVITLQPPPGIGNVAAAPSGAVTVHNVPLANIYWPFGASRGTASRARKMLWHGLDTANAVMGQRVGRIVRRVRPDVVLTHNLQGFSTAVMPAIKRTGTSLVHVLHDYALICPQTVMWRNGRGCGTRDERCAGCRVLTTPRWRHLESVDAVISVSRSLLTFHRLHGLFTDVPATVIHNALRAGFGIRREVAPRDGEFTFGYLGRVERSKGIETLLAAAAELAAAGLRFRVRVAGRGDAGYIDSLRQRWPLDNVEYVGFADAPAFLANIDTLVFPSEWLEALGNGVFEAYSQGVPVIGSAVGGIPELIDHGATGFTFTPGDFVDLAARMRRMLTEPQLHRGMAEAALERAVDFLASHRAREYLEFLDTVVDKAPRRRSA
ncbi:MAG: glycosyltransferase [Gammaproteobacteria bacterium]|nr:glycosyltransferase [Gammaproteobacteria bacterium]